MADHIRGTRPDHDPGWGAPKDIVIGALVPQLAIRRAKSQSLPLVAMRTLFSSFVSSLLLIGVVVVLVTGGSTHRSGSMSIPAACGLAVVIAVAAVTFGLRFRRALPCGDAGQLLGAYRTRFFLRMAWNNGAALAGFVISFLTESPWPYFAALPIALIGHWLTAPSWRNIQADDRNLAARGCPTLSDAFRASTPSPSGAPPAPPPTAAPARPSPPNPPLGPYHQPDPSDRASGQ